VQIRLVDDGEFRSRLFKLVISRFGLPPGIANDGNAPIQQSSRERNNRGSHSRSQKNKADPGERMICSIGKRKIRQAARNTKEQTVSQLFRNILFVNARLEQTRRCWAGALGVSGPQFSIIAAVADLDSGIGVSVKNVSAVLNVDPSFVTTQSKDLERNGYLLRLTSEHDARVVLMSLSDKARQQIQNLSPHQDLLYEMIFAEFDEHALYVLADQLASLEGRLERANLLIGLDI
jgi:DNA-binding MarR family transcriptional regulator